MAQAYTTSLCSINFIDSSCLQVADVGAHVVRHGLVVLLDLEYISIVSVRFNCVSLPEDG